jgi:Stress responsive A/B Barrel Domain
LSEEEEARVFIHIFGFRWKPQATEADKARAAHDIVVLRDHILGLIDVHVGPNLSPRGQGYTFAGLMTFTDKAAADAYTTHPMHLALLKWLVPLIDPVELDFEA